MWLWACLRVRQGLFRYRIIRSLTPMRFVRETDTFRSEDPRNSRDHPARARDSQNPARTSMSGRVTARGAASEPRGALRGISFTVLLIALFCIYSRVFEFGFGYLHITVICYGLVLLTAVLSGRILRSLSSLTGILFLCLAAWLVTCIPFSVFPTGAAHVVQIMFLFGLSSYLVISALCLDYSDLRRTVHTLAYAVLFLALLTIAFGVTTNGRLYPGQGRFANPNDFAQVLLMMLPFWWYMLQSPLSSRMRRAIAMVAICLLLITMACTGSRGALIGAGVTVLIPFWHSSHRQKVVFVAAGVLLVLIVGVVLPEHIEQRFFTFFAASEPVSLEEAQMVRDAIGSSEGRWQLLKDSLWLTATHPLFGVGPGQFPVAQDELAKERDGLKGQWLVTHNSYTQVSSEAGIPGLIFYLAILAVSLRLTRAPRKAHHARETEAISVQDGTQLRLAIRSALMAYAISTLFSSVAYSMFLPTLAGLAVCFSRLTKQIVTTSRSASPPQRSLPAATSHNTWVRVENPACSGHQTNIRAALRRNPILQ